MTVRKVNSNSYENGDIHNVGANSVVFTKGDMVTDDAGKLILAVAAAKISGVCKTTATMASDNQTVAMVEVVYEEQKDSTTYEMTITGGTLTAANEQDFFDLSDEVTVDGTSGSATTGQVQMIEYISATAGIFKIVNL